MELFPKSSLIRFTGCCEALGTRPCFCSSAFNYLHIISIHFLLQYYSNLSILSRQSLCCFLSFFLKIILFIILLIIKAAPKACKKERMRREQPERTATLILRIPRALIALITVHAVKTASSQKCDDY